MSTLPIVARYRNYEGKVAVRRIIPGNLVHSSAPPWHKDDQWLLEGYDADRDGNPPRTFALSGFLAFAGPDGTFPADTEKKALYRLLIAGAYAAHSNALVGNQSPAVADKYRLMKNPRPGDYVLELSTVHSFREDGVGRLIAVRREFVAYDEPDGDEKGYFDTFWYIETLAGDLARWHNCSFIRIFDETLPGQIDKPENLGWAKAAAERHDLGETTNGYANEPADRRSKS